MTRVLAFPVLAPLGVSSSLVTAMTMRRRRRIAWSVVAAAVMACHAVVGVVVALWALV